MLTPETAREKVLSPEERCRIARGLIAQKVIDILDHYILVAVGSGDNQVNVTLAAKECTDPDQNIRQYLSILGFQNIQVSSDFPGYNESYQGSTTIKFRVP